MDVLYFSPSLTHTLSLSLYRLLSFLQTPFFSVLAAFPHHHHLYLLLVRLLIFSRKKSLPHEWPYASTSENKNSKEIERKCRAKQSGTMVFSSPMAFLQPFARADFFNTFLVKLFVFHESLEFCRQTLTHPQWKNTRLTKWTKDEIFVFVSSKSDAHITHPTTVEALKDNENSFLTVIFLINYVIYVYKIYHL